MAWRKLGLVYCAHGERDWARTHAYIPTVFPVDPARLRVFVAFLDRDKVGRIGWVDVSPEDPRRVLAVSERPALDVGAPGSFDEHGVTPICAFASGSNHYLSYVGWQRGRDVRYRLLTGLARSLDCGMTFQRCSAEPLLPASSAEPFFRTAAHIRFDRDRWRMWYVAGNRWVRHGDKAVPAYNIRYLESADDVTRWPAEGTVVLDTTGPDEYGLGRPFLVRDGETYRMWYSIRTFTRGYRLGYAESPDGLSWTRKDADVGIDVSREGWDSEMICFGAIHETASGRFLFYNGNGFGETGFGVAVWDA